eukprot:m.148992 g.148992  ORF g.148992 m.148992 type:complete len:218 (-) comp14198_c0_seq2:284-937(-)
MPLLEITQALSGLAFSLFSTAHMGNIFASLISQHAFDTTLRNLRTIYHTPWVEMTGAATLVLHVGAGIWRARHRTKAEHNSAEARLTLHRMSGYLLGAALSAHITVMRVLPMINHQTYRVCMSFVADHLYRYPIVFPFYVTLLLSGVYHTIYGIDRSLAILRIKSPSTHVLDNVIGILSIFSILSIYAFNGSFYTVYPTSFGGNVARFSRQVRTSRW